MLLVFIFNLWNESRTCMALPISFFITKKKLNKSVIFYFMNPLAHTLNLPTFGLSPNLSRLLYYFGAMNRGVKLGISTGSCLVQSIELNCRNGLTCNIFGHAFFGLVQPRTHWFSLSLAQIICKNNSSLFLPKKWHAHWASQNSPLFFRTVINEPAPPKTWTILSGQNLQLSTYTQ